MLRAGVFLGLAFLVGVFLDSWKRSGTGPAILSPIFYFAFLWWLGFPVHAWLLDEGWVDTQQTVVLTHWGLVLSVVVSMVFMAIVWVGSRKTLPIGVLKRLFPKAGDGTVKRSAWVLAGLNGCAIYFLANTVLQGWEWTPYVGNQQNEARVGNGPLFLLSELFTYGMIAVTPLLLQEERRDEPGWRWLLVVYATGLGLGLFMGIALSSRRVIVLAAFAFALAYFYLKRRSGWLAVALVLFPVFAAPTLQSLRYVLTPVQETRQGAPATAADGGCAVRAATIIRVAGERESLAEGASSWPCQASGNALGYFAQITASTYGFSDHLATFLQKASAGEIAFGVDHGESWLYNAALGLVPRAIWSGKPLQYGSVAEQKWLYPGMYEDSPVTMTLPPSFIVDYLFGFGVVSAVGISYLTGRALGSLSRWLLAGGAFGPARFSFALFVLAYLFNWVRGGTGFIQQVVLFAVVLWLVYGREPQNVVVKEMA